jgi:hypothetical protein
MMMFFAPNVAGFLWSLLTGALDHPDDRLAARLLSHSVTLFMRPSEWLWANLEGNALTIRNGKSTNGRALGKHRQLNLRDYGEAGVRDLSDLLAELKSQAQDADDFRKLWAKLASRIARACESIHIKRLAPYSTRHVGMAEGVDVARASSSERRSQDYDNSDDPPVCAENLNPNVAVMKSAQEGV